MFDRRSRLGHLRSDRARRASLVIRRELELLEGRLLLATFTVININDSGPGSLRDGINTINLDLVGPNAINFAISAPPGTVSTIAPATALPIITQPVVIDGYTQPGSSPNTNTTDQGGSNAVLRIELDGSGVPGQNGLNVSAAGTTIRGLVINRFGGVSSGINISRTSNTQIVGNFIGTDVTGTFARPNGQGIAISFASSNLIGGTAPADRNVISGNDLSGIALFGVAASPATENRVQGNLIGTNAAGTAAIPNGPGNSGAGVQVVGAARTLIGGTTPGAGNLISGNNTFGINLSSSDLANGGTLSTGSLVQGNRIGTDVTGTSPLPNTLHGIQSTASLTTFVSLDAVIGGTEPGAGNTIAFNGLAGVAITRPSGVRVLGNAIYSNGGLGIDLGGGDFAGDGVTPNDPGDADAGANNLQNFPVITSVVASAVSTTFTGTLNSTPNTTFTLQFFSNTVPDPSMFGEGRSFLGEATVTTDSAGNAAFNAVVRATPPGEGSYTATATDLAGNTSEFSAVLTFTVFNTNDSGFGSLRQAILNANAAPGLQTITFNIPGPGVQTIRPLSGLPFLFDAVTIDGYTQPGSSPNTNTPDQGGSNAVPLIELDGSGGGGGIGLVVFASGTTVRGLVINRFGSIGILIIREGNSIVGNFIGTDATGTIDLGNGSGVDSGVFIDGASNNTIGGATPEARNVISGNNGNGVTIASSAGSGFVANNNSVLGNLIGTDRTGTVALGNSRFGIEVSGSQSRANNTTIGGTVAGARNIISGNGDHGVLFTNGGIGTGGVAAGSVVQGNFIGTDVTGTAALGNVGDGVVLDASAVSFGVSVGGTASGAGNVIAFNRIGVRLSTGVGSAVLSNAIFANRGLGIDLGLDGVTANDPMDPDPGVNLLQNYPVVTSISTGSVVTVFSTLNSTPKTLFRVQAFLNDSTDPSGFGEGQRYIQDFMGVDTFATTDANGDATFQASYILTLSPGQSITLTATDPAGNTSEFSLAFTFTPLASFVVTNTDDTGSGSLRQVITDANAAPGLQTITFNIDASGVQTIAPLSPLPAITDPVLIDAYTQPGASPNTLAVGGNAVILVDLRGGSAGTAIGLVVAASGVTIRGLAISGFSDAAIFASTVDTVTIAGNYLGLDASGTTAPGNGGAGIQFRGVTASTIGGVSPGARNIIAGNQGQGILLRTDGSLASTLVLIAGNYIGTDPAGTAAPGNALAGIALEDANNVTIGGLTVAARNVVSGNAREGVLISGAGGSKNTILGNFVGTDSTGTADLGNVFDGVQIFDAPGNTIGGLAAGAGNVISGNGEDGVDIGFGAATGNVVAGNFIGTDAAGTAALGNTSMGVRLSGAVGSTIGGLTPQARNVISANADGVAIQLGAANNLVVGNSIGTDLTGSVDLGNLNQGVDIFGGSTGNTIGGSAIGAGNLISGNAFSGVFLAGVGTSGNVVLGNRIGTDTSGAFAIANAGDGISISDAPSNVIGGTAPGAGNLVSGNARHGIQIVSPGSIGNVVAGNRIGTNAAGSLPLGNAQSGVLIRLGASSTTIGGGNLISGNLLDGIGIIDAGTTGNLVAGNFIGTSADGLSAVGNGLGAFGMGVRITDAPSNTIGGADPGAGNLISGNEFHQVDITGANARFNVVAGNTIGPDVTGRVSLSSGSGTGVVIGEVGTTGSGGSDNTIGGTAPGAGNLISGNGGSDFGVGIDGLSTTRNVVQGNRIGTNVDASAALANGNGVGIGNGAFGNTIGGSTPGAPNLISGNVNSNVLFGGSGPNVVQGNLIGTNATGTASLDAKATTTAGIFLDNGSTGVTIGGSVGGQGNVISGNAGNGILIQGQSVVSGPLTNGIVVAGNFIGTNASGTAAVPNGGDGVAITSSPGSTIGGSSAGSRNVISANAGAGISMSGIESVGTLIAGNFIGTDRAGTAALGNTLDGVNLVGVRGVTIGGVVPGAGNAIAFNGGAGIAVNRDVATGNAILSNSIFNNKIGIDLGGDGPTPNRPGGPHLGPNNLQNTPVLADARSDSTTITVAGSLNSTPSTTFTVQFFADGGDVSGLAEGRVFVGQRLLTTDAGGNAAINLVLAFPGIPVGAAITATATDPGGNTSEFSLDTVVRNVNDSGFGSLRQAITNANGVGQATTIRFNVPSPQGGPVTILPNSPLPAISSPVAIDGYTQPGSRPNTLALGDDAVLGVAISGFNGAAPVGLDVISDGVTIRGLAIGRFLEAGIRAQGRSGLVISGNFLGLDPADPAAVFLNNYAVRLDRVTASTIGGTTPADRNVIASNSVGIALFGTAFDGTQGSDANLIAGNYLGTDRSGRSARGNDNAIYISYSSNNTIGGTTSAARNVISGNGNGVLIGGSSSLLNVIAGNYIGTGADGLSGLPGLSNNGSGIVVSGDDGRPPATYMAIIGTPDGAGGPLPAGGNVISSNRFAGIASTRGRILVRGNLIGTDATGAAPLGNRYFGINLDIDAGSFIGGTGAGEANVIAFNGLLDGTPGIREPSPTSGIFRANSIHDNGGLGIDILSIGPDDPPPTVQDYPYFPTLLSALPSGVSTRVTGALRGLPNTLSTLDFFTSDAADPSGFGEGATYIGSSVVNIDASGQAAFALDLPAIAPGKVLTATATSVVTATAIATSEFSRALRVGGAAIPALALTATVTPVPAPVATDLTYTVTTQNVGKGSVRGVGLALTLPNFVAITDASRASILGQGGSIVPDSAGFVAILLPVGTLPVGESKSLIVRATAITAGSFGTNAGVIFLNPDGGPSAITTTVVTTTIFTFTVLNDHEFGFGSLRQAIQNADANPGVDTIDFKLPNDQLTLAPVIPLPAITDPTIIDATTQAGFAGTPLVALDGSKANAPGPNDVGPFGGLIVRSGGTTIRGLIVRSFTDNAIVLVGASGSLVAGNVLVGNDTGVLIQNSSANTIGGTTPADRNVISANASLGIDVANSTRNVIAGNYIGVDPTGLNPLGNGLNGVFLDNSADNTIGGLTPGSGNVISANRQVNIQIFNTRSARNVVIGNLIGTDATGSSGFTGLGLPGGVTDVGVFINSAPANTIGGATPAARNIISGSGVGVELFTPGAVANVVAGNYVGTDRTGARPIANTIGVLLLGAPNNTVSGNVASGNVQAGIRIDGPTGSNNLVVGNIVGLDASGAAALPNRGDGIFLVNAPSNTIGGATPGAGNIVTGNGSVGIQIFGPNAANNVVEGNLVGAAANGTEPGNGAVGVFLNNAPGNTIGGTVAGAGNLVAGNRLIGIQVSGRSAVANVILGNMVRNNGEVGISSENAPENQIGITGPNANIVTGSPIAFQPVPTPGPTVTVLTPRVQGATITGVALTFDETVSPGRAGNKRAYRVDILNLRGRKIGSVVIRAASFDEATNTVSLTFARAVPAGRSYRLIALGQGPRAITDKAGHPLDGARTGGSGTDFFGRFGGLAPTTGTIASRSVPVFRRAMAFARA